MPQSTANQAPRTDRNALRVRYKMRGHIPSYSPMSGRCKVILQRLLSPRFGIRLGVARVLLAAMLCNGAVAQAQNFPSRNLVTFVVPFTVGTAADIIARLFGPKLAERWKVAVVTENRTGASGNIASELVARSAPDGHTLYFTATTFASSPAMYPKLPFDPATSFTPVALIALSGVSLCVTPQFPAKTLREFIDAVRVSPGKYSYASPGNGGPQHMAMELFKLEAKIDIVHVPYKGTGTAMTDLIGGHVQAMMVPVHTAAPLVHGGKLRMLAVTSHERSPAFPDLPTVGEQGVPVPPFETWYGVLAPAGMPLALVAKLNADISAVAREPDVGATLAKQGMTVTTGTPERFGELLKKELAMWARVVRENGIKPD
jgi:tripartite-type tricarboxylate transporter receptor subunit TctC